jgi:predicted DNA-binding protein YlxM (UPF0122 family)
MIEIMNVAKSSTGLISDNFSRSGKIALDYAEKLSLAKNKMMTVEQKLTDQEKMRYESSLNLIESYQKEVEVLAEKVTQEEKNLEQIFDSNSNEKQLIEIEKERAAGL